MKRNASPRIRFVFPLLMTFLASFTAMTTQAVDTVFLDNHVNDDGSIALTSDVSMSFQSTVESLNTLIEYGLGDAAYIDQAITYLDNSGADRSTENIALSAIVNYRTGKTVLDNVALLKERQNRDGGFGAFLEYSSTPFDTALALKALTIANQMNSTMADAAITYLQNQQTSAGGWNLNVSNRQSIEVTAVVLDVLRLYSVRYNLQSTLQDAIAYLYDLQETDGSWLDNATTAKALLALIPVTSDTSRYADSIKLLEQNQLADASWEHDVYITALALRAIKTADTITMPVDPSSAYVSGQLLDGSTQLPLADVTVTLSGNGEVTEFTSSSGDFVLPISETGSYSVTYSKTGYLSATQSLTIQKIQNVNLGIVQLIPVPDTNPSYAILSGIVTEATSGTPVAGATIIISGSSPANVLTDANGVYSLQLDTAGTIVISVSKEGYQAINASSQIALGDRLTFSPGVYKDDETPPDDISMTGRILDESNGQPIAGATLSVTQDGQATVDAISDDSGGVTIDHLVEGTLAASITAPGYRSVEFSAIAPAGSHIALGDVRLTPAPTAVTIIGTVTDAADNSIIANATIEVVDTQNRVNSVGDGSYQIEGIDRLQFSIRISATGYESSIAQVSLQSFQTVEINPQLNALPVNQAGFGISLVEMSADQYGAYEKALTIVDLYNNADAAADLQMVMEVSNDSGYFERFPAVHRVLENDVADSLLHVPAQTEILQAEFDWMTGTMPPGEYQVIIQAYDLNTLALKAEKATTVTIAEDAHILSLVGRIEPAYSNYQAEENLILSVEINNESNVTIDLPVIYRWRHPDGSVLHEGQLTIHITADEINSMTELENFSHTFDSDGDYVLELDTNGGVIPDAILSGSISVAPAVRIDPSLSINPDVVVPDGNKRIHLNITLTGRNEG